MAMRGLATGKTGPIATTLTHIKRQILDNIQTLQLFYVKSAQNNTWRSMVLTFPAKRMRFESTAMIFAVHDTRSDIVDFLKRTYENRHETPHSSDTGTITVHLIGGVNIA